MKKKTKKFVLTKLKPSLTFLHKIKLKLHKFQTQTNNPLIQSSRKQLP